ncbi:hypothetical protein [Paenibacillus sp. MMO-58]|uniref:hypothetical protein n=1 Tax=Paenibacillus sp. MMO-58 TaxID=3081290 RepID=UPI00301A7ED5
MHGKGRPIQGAGSFLFILVDGKAVGWCLGELRVVVLVKDKVQEETRAVNDMVAAMAGRFTPVIYDVNAEEGKNGGAGG